MAISFSNVIWHGASPAMKASGSCSTEYSGTSGSNMTVYGSCTVTNARVYSDAKYEYNVTSYVSVDGTNAGSGTITHSSYSGSGTYSYSLSGLNYGNHTIQVHMVCGYPDGCDVGFPDVVVGSTTLYVPNPYSEYTLALNWAKGENDSGGSSLFKHTNSFYANYTMTGGTDSITSAYIYANTSNSKSTSSYTKRWSIGTTKQTATKTCSDGLSEATRYYIYVGATDGTTAKTAGTKSVYTYRKPTLTGVSVATSFTTNANTANTFTLSGINTRKWTSSPLESTFTTYYKINNNSTTVPSFSTSSLGTSLSLSISSSTGTWSRTASQMRSLVPYDNGNGDGTNNRLAFIRYSPSASWISSVASINVKIYYRPRVGVTSSNTTLRLNSSSGDKINQGAEITNTSSLNYIYVSWTYDTTITNAGYTQGYRIRVYNNSDTVVKTYYTTNKYYSIPVSDIPKVYLTYIDITPYYGNGQSSNASASYASNYVYYDSPAKFSFVQIVSELATPTITYPIASSSWINKDFRVCLQLPIDPDYSSISGTYTYEDIELYVNGTIISLKSGTTSASSEVNVQPSCFSTTDLTYQKKIVIYPNYVEGIVDDSLSYSLKVRVKKQYGASTTNPRWSSWSEMRTFSVSTADYTNYQPQVEDLIMATHYNDVLGFVNRIRNTYGVSWSDIPSSAIANSTLIEASQYSYDNLLDKLNETKSQVNNYATYGSDKEYIKFDYTDELPTTGIEETVGELITAEKNEDNTETRAGRNYIKYVYDRGILLK